MKLWKKDGRIFECCLMVKINNWDCFDGRFFYEIIVIFDFVVEDVVDFCVVYYQNVSFMILYFNFIYFIYGMLYMYRVKNLLVFRDYIYLFFLWFGFVLF